MKKKKVEKVKVEKINKEATKEDEPSLYHYVIVVIVFIGLIALVGIGIKYLDKEINPNNGLLNKNNTPIFYKYDYVTDEKTYKLNFRHSPEELENTIYNIEATKNDILNSKTLTFSFLNYNGSDNGEITKASSFLIATMKIIFKFDISNENIVNFNETNCSTSTIENKVLVFNPYYNETGVFINKENGCIEFNTNNPKIMPKLVDKFVYELAQK